MVEVGTTAALRANYFPRDTFGPKELIEKDVRAALKAIEPMIQGQLDEAGRYRLAWLSARRRAASNRRYAAELALAADELYASGLKKGYSKGYSRGSADTEEDYDL